MTKKRFYIIILMLMIFPFTSFAQKNNSKIEVQKITSAEFEKLVYNINEGEKAVYKGKVPCIVDFYADWCRPCKIISPILEELQKEYGGKIIIYKIDTDAEKELARSLGISAIPTLYFFPKKQKPIVKRGALTKEMLKEIIDNELKP